MIYKFGIQLFLLFFLTFFTIFITPVKAQQYSYNNYGIYIVFPQGNPPPMPTIQNGIPTVMSFFQTFMSSTLCGYGSCMDDDGSYIAIQFFPSSVSPEVFIPRSTPLCPIPSEEVTIGTIDAIKSDTKCFYGISGIWQEQYIIQASDKVVRIVFYAPDEFTFDSHYEDFEWSLNTLQLQYP